MKRNNKTLNAIIAGMFICSLASCISVNYMSVTRINPDGSCLREIYAKGDSAFLAGNRSYNPYMFNPGSDWTVTPSEATGKDAKYNVKISKTADRLEGFSTESKFDEKFRPLVAPAETLQKRFGWFYTYYTFKTVYPCIADKIPVSIDKYMNKDEQELWFQGNFSAYPGMTGLELKHEMDNMENKFLEWYTKNVQEAYFDVICDFEKRLGNSRHIAQLSAIKDSVFQNGTDELVDILKLFDKYLETNYFSDLYKTDKRQIDEMCNERLLEDLLSRDIEYKLIMPGKLISSNAPLISQDTLTWKIMAANLIPDNYELTATSRTANIWAFAVVFLFVAVSGYCLIKTKMTRF
ncbi:MAG: hypothetical protein LBU37_06340 [Tannerellaceae bacterium]|jgi:hypothetical protein|nr:hypothetical protein [Tannerellaceae bacterium]